MKLSYLSLLLSSILLFTSCSNSNSSKSSDTPSDENEQTLPAPWTKVFGEEGDDTYAVDVKTDADGNSYVISNLNSVGGNLRKFNSTGEEEWVVENFSLDVMLTALAVGEDGYLYVTGYLYDQGEDTEIHIFELDSAITLIGSNDFFICQFDLPNGENTWCKNFGESALSYNPTAILVKSDMIFVGGKINSTDVDDKFLAKFDLESDEIGEEWQAIAKLSDSAAFPVSIAFDSTQEHVYFASTLSVSGPYNGPGSLSSPAQVGGLDIALIKFGLDLSPEWIKRYGVSGQSYQTGDQAVAVDSNDNIYVVGSTDDIPEGDEFSGVTEAGFVIKFGDAESDPEESYFIPKNVVYSSGGNVIISSNVLVGSDDSIYVVNSEDTSFVGHVLKLDSDFTTIWEQGIDNQNGSILISGLSLTPDNILHVFGNTEHGLYEESDINSDVGLKDSFITTIHPDGTGDN